MNNTVPTRVTILGSGTCVPSVKRSACAALITTARSVIVMDLGPGTMRRLIETGTSVTAVTHVFFSHFHPDHTGELSTFIFANKYPDQTRRTHPLTVGAGTGFAAFYDNYRSVYGRWIELPPDLFTLLEFDTAGETVTTLADFSITTAPVSHNPESLAFKGPGPTGNPWSIPVIPISAKT